MTYKFAEGYETCPDCKGEKYYEVGNFYGYRCLGEDLVTRPQMCPKCSGKGFIRETKKCSTCGGSKS